jgi:hypothetical protein
LDMVANYFYKNHAFCANTLPLFANIYSLLFNYGGRFALNILTALRGEKVLCVSKSPLIRFRTRFRWKRQGKRKKKCIKTRINPSKIFLSLNL